MRGKLIAIGVLFLTAALAASATDSVKKAAEVSRFGEIFGLEGWLLDSENRPLTGSYDFTFRLYQNEVGGSPIWTEVHQAVKVEEGRYDVLLGTGTPLSISSEKLYWLGIEVNKDGEMLPRQPLGGPGSSRDGGRDTIPLKEPLLYAGSFDPFLVAAYNDSSGAAVWGIVGDSLLPPSGGIGVRATNRDFGGIGTALRAEGTSEFTGQIKSFVATGTAPFQVTSTTLNANLNADMLDGCDSSAFLVRVGNNTATGDFDLKGSFVTDGDFHLTQDFTVGGVIRGGPPSHDVTIADTIVIYGLWDSRDNARIMGGLDVNEPITAGGAPPFIVDDSTLVVNLNADMVDGQHASGFVTPRMDYGRPGVTNNLYEGDTTLTYRYVNEGQPNSISSEMIIDEGIAAVDIDTNAVGASELAPKSVYSGHIVNGQVATVDLADNAVTSEKVQDGQVTSEDIANETIVNADISLVAEIAPSKISGTAWTSTNDGPGSGLDADMLDGRQSGNGGGNIPVNNGIRNKNLNADMVNGIHGDKGAAEDSTYIPMGSDNAAFAKISLGNTGNNQWVDVSCEYSNGYLMGNYVKYDGTTTSIGHFRLSTSGLILYTRTNAFDSAGHLYWNETLGRIYISEDSAFDGWIEYNYFYGP